MSALTILSHKLKHFDLSAKEKMERYLQEVHVDVSDYTFAANYIWLSKSSGFFTIIDDTFCLFVLNGNELSMLLPPLGRSENVYRAIFKCFDIMNQNNSSNYYSKIEYVHETILEGFMNYIEEGAMLFDSMESYVVEKKLVDYVYRCDDLIELKGNAFHAKRNEINKFKNANPDFRIERLDSRKHEEEITLLFNKWVGDRIKYMPKEEADIFLDGIYQERLAIKRMLKDYSELELLGIVIYIKEELKGFTVGEKIDESTASILVEKTDFEVLGCAQFIFREFCKLLKNEFHVEHINVGDDMGFENLKKVKMSYRPERLIPKYTLYQK